MRIAHVAREQGDRIVEAILHCSNPQCQREYPVIDGIPLLLRNLRQFVSDNALRLLGRSDLDPMLESLIGDCLGPGSDFDTARQQVSAYAWEHYADLDPGEEPHGSRPGTLLQALRAALELAGPLSPGPILDVGCAPGRSTFALAERTGETVLGIDLHLPMLRLAGGVLTDGAVRYDRRRVGMVYDRRVFSANFPGAERVDFWACDATALPFTEGTFSAVTALNVLDCMHAPGEFLASLATVLAPAGRAMLTTPYDWSPAATPVEAWLGGHSQRAPADGSSKAALRSLLAQDRARGGPGLELLAEREGLPWRVRLHERSTMLYDLHLFVVGRRNGAPR